MQKINPCLWFNCNAEEAVNFYLSIFKNSKINQIARYGNAGFEIHKMKSGTVMTIEFELLGQVYVALNGGPDFKFTEAVSFIVNCETQEEVDELWEKLSEGGGKGPCGWLKDKYRLSWQIVPTILGKMFQDEDAEKRDRVMAAMLQMKKLDIKILEQAYNEK
ncbi:MAG: VOC family protein [Candidatus Protochlamydia sp.]|nr:VOC family protein [Candidatus Protochlamydia sp.]